MYQALYRKYRPRTFDDVCGQTAITSTLKNELAAGKPSHAYLFTGLRGSGKTTCSKIIAKAVNCLHPNEGNPCCECAICKGIDKDAVTDVMEIDAASNSGVDYIRELREQAFLRPVQCHKRVYIIDEVHMLSTEAFNALLKIMEEPPEHVLFILATTEAHKVPATVASRCQRFDFKRIEPDAIAARLGYIAGQEGFSVEREAALLIARLSEGGMRDAISLLDQCWSRSPAIDLQTVADCAGLPDHEELFVLSGAALAGDTTAALSALEGICRRSMDIPRLCEQLIAHLRNLMLAKCTDRLEELVVCLPDELERYKRAAAASPLEDLLGALRQLQDAHSRMGRTANPRLELEMALIRLSASPPPQELGGLEARVAKLETLLRAGTAPAVRPVQREAPAAAMLSQPDAVKEPEAVPAPPPSETAEDLRKKAAPFRPWADILERLKEKNRALYGALAGSEAYLAGDLVLIDSRNALFIKLIRENDYARQHIHECIIEATGKKHRIGPYKSELYRVEQEEDPLEALLHTADGLGVDVTVKES
ncbi:MAG: DNA polymerase III subunit gamma/tau [Provencibacterium sp.]|jgi:DNA polymerase-3 subunit gamma/tau|nr:DNA polymerase III subunit gamma/tau [Provencibacterium sp.]